MTDRSQPKPHPDSESGAPTRESDVDDVGRRAGPRAPKRRITIVGAGFSGLAAAYFLSRAGFQVEVIEREDRPGGLIATERASFGLVETGANAILNSQRVEELFGLIGLELIGTKAESKKRYIFRRGSPRRWPVGPLASLRVLLFTLLYFVIPKAVAPREKESVRDWATRVMGGEAAHYLVEAALQGIYAGDPARLSARLVFARFFRRRKRLTPPKIRGSVSAPDGMGQLITRWRERLQRQGVQFILSQNYRTPETSPQHPLIIATSVAEASVILRGIDPVRAAACEKVEMLPLISVTIGFRSPPPKAQGFGCLFPPIEGMRALGVLMNTFIFPNRSTKGFSETWMFGGARAAADLMEFSDERLVAMAIEERQGALGADGEYYGYRVTKWPAALPHYNHALEDALPELKGLRRNVVLMGNYLGDIGLTRILDRAALLPKEINSKGEWLE